MKTLKFEPKLCELILNGTKTATWRFFDEKDLRIGDTLQFITKETGEVFGTAVITDVYVKTLGTLNEADWAGHEGYPSEEIMYQTYRGYYGDKVNENTEVKIVRFDFKR